jgi:hypothetical protein
MPLLLEAPKPAVGVAAQPTHMGKPIAVGDQPK